MTTNAQAIAALEAAKTTLQGQVAAADMDTADNLMAAIHNISDEIGDLEKIILSDADYVPQTDPFKKATADGQAFVNLLTELKNNFSRVIQVAAAIDQVLKLAAGLAL